MEEEATIKIYSSEEQNVLFRNYQDGIIAEKDGMLWLRLNGQLYSCKNTSAGRRILSGLRSGVRKSMDSYSMELEYKRFLMTGDEVIAAILEHHFHIPDRKIRYVILLRNAERQELKIEAIRELLPLEMSDVLLEHESGDIILLKAQEEADTSEAAEYTRAVLETVETESGIRLKAGIGSVADVLRDLPASYRDAADALQLAAEFAVADSVVISRDLILERFIREISKERCFSLARQEFGRTEGWPEDEELIETARAFLRYDLNLSLTAKQLYIHRNTLNYRLEKIRKCTGLDLHQFRDAVAFQVFLSLRNRLRMTVEKAV